MPRRSGKQLLFKRIVELGLAESEKEAKAWILTGEIIVEDETCRQPQTWVDLEARIEHRSPSRYVSRFCL